MQSLVGAFSVLLLLGLTSFAVGEDNQKAAAQKALQPFGILVGKWKGSAAPLVRTDSQKYFWSEKQTWSWKFDKKDAWLVVDFSKNKIYDSGELRYLPKKKQYQLTLKTVDKKTHTYQGTVKSKRFTAVGEDPATKAQQKLVFTLLRNTRYYYQYSRQEKGRRLFKAIYRVGVNREGVLFARGSGQPECIVSGGLGTIEVTYKGKTYHVCCSGCAAEFEVDPERYIAEYKSKQAKKK
ncbi:MAG: YHS domain-containing protein [Gemmataceae bacterium]